jgi:hypothetical protein
MLLVDAVISRRRMYLILKIILFFKDNIYRRGTEIKYFDGMLALIHSFVTIPMFLEIIQNKSEQSCQK